jgi:hypothetical protein
VLAMQSTASMVMAGRRPRKMRLHGHKVFLEGTLDDA